MKIIKQKFLFKSSLLLSLAQKISVDVKRLFDQQSKTLDVYYFLFVRIKRSVIFLKKIIFIIIHNRKWSHIRKLLLFQYRSAQETYILNQSAIMFV